MASGFFRRRLLDERDIGTDSLMDQRFGVDEEELSRASIWTIRPQWQVAYFGLFSIQILVGIGYVAWHEIAGRAGESVYEIFTAIIAQTGSIGIASAAIAIALTEVMQYIMVTADWLRQKLIVPLKEKQREEGREQGRRDGRTEANARWRAWNERRMEAEARGELFDEPIPYSENGT